MIAGILIALGTLLFFVAMYEFITYVTYGNKQPTDDLIERSLAVAELTDRTTLFCYRPRGYDSVGIHKYFGVVHKYSIYEVGSREWTVVYPWTPCKKMIDKAFEELKK